MTTSKKGIELIQMFEGCRLTAYKCPAGVWTVGYGSTKDVKAGMKITQAEADKRLLDDISPCERVLNNMGINYRQNQFDALISWLFNFGSAKFASSTLKKKILSHASDVEITDQIVKWVNAGKVPLLGLKRRRVAEANMFLGRDLYYIDGNNNIKKK